MSVYTAPRVYVQAGVEAQGTQGGAGCAQGSRVQRGPHVRSVKVRLLSYYVIKSYGASKPPYMCASCLLTRHPVLGLTLICVPRGVNP